jgi:hypothetical protein
VNASVIPNTGPCDRGDEAGEKGSPFLLADAANQGRAAVRFAREGSTRYAVEKAKLAAHVGAQALGHGSPCIRCLDSAAAGRDLVAGRA